MHSVRGVFLCATVALLVSCATPPVRVPRPAVNIPAEVIAEFEHSVAAWNAGNLEAFLNIYADSASFTLAEEFLQGRASIREFYAPNFLPGAIRDELTMEQLDVEVLSPEVVLVRGIYRNSRAGQVTRRGTTTLIMRKFLHVWRIVHDHSS